MWNKADIRAVLLSYERSIAPFPRCLQNWLIFQQLSSIFSFKKTRWRQLNFSENQNIKIFLLLADVAVLDCFSYVP